MASARFINFGDMLPDKKSNIVVQKFIVNSSFLEREVIVDCYLPHTEILNNEVSLLIINDGQDLVTMQFENILQNLYNHNQIEQLFCVALHCSADRKNEYGTAKVLDYMGRGTKAAFYNNFIMEELLPFIRKTFAVTSFKEKSYAGFSLGGLSALDIVWNNPQEFCKAGIFSGSFWWRDKSQNDADFNESVNRIMHRQIREGNYNSWQKFFFEVGTQDETADRNNNGIIDAIDDTISLIEELKLKGFAENDIKYVELKDGKHDVPTWARAFPDFLKWGWPVTT